MQQHELNGKQVTLYPIPSGYLPRMEDGKLAFPVGFTSSSAYYTLGEGWEYIGTTETMTEEQAAELVQIETFNVQTNSDGPFTYPMKMALNYVTNNWSFDDRNHLMATESFRSWLTSINFSGNAAILVKQ